MKKEFQISQLIEGKCKKNQFQWIIPIDFQQDLNMYRLNDSTFVNQLHQNHLGFKHQNTKINQFRWYLLPEEALYLISIQELPVQTQSNNNKKKYKTFQEFEQQKQQNIRKIYSNCKKNDTIKLLFYLNIRKKSKIVRKCFTQLKFDEKQYNQKQFHLSNNFADFCYKIYQTAADYRNDENYQIFVLVDNKSLITQMIFTTEIQKICQKLKILTLKFVLFQNNDYMIIEIRT